MIKCKWCGRTPEQGHRDWCGNEDAKEAWNDAIAEAASAAEPVDDVLAGVIRHMLI